MVCLERRPASDERVELMFRRVHSAVDCVFRCHYWDVDDGDDDECCIDVKIVLLS